jgi:hypothetical protein
MEKTITVLLATMLILPGCLPWTTHHDSIVWPDGTTSEIMVSSDGVVTAKNGDVEITADHRGKTSIVEQVLGIGVAAVSEGVQVEVGD